MPFDQLGKLLVVLGGLVVVLGLVLLLFGKSSFLGKLPGDINISSGNFTCVVPLVSMLLISLVLTVLLNLALRLLNR